MRRLPVLALLAASLLPPQARAAKPNFLFLLADDLGWFDVGFNGRKDWRTPNLDRLAAQGTVFKRWYTAAVVCAPSRAALMTGKYTIHNGVSGNSDDLPAGQVTLPEALRKHGYATAIFGKWHHGRPRPGMKSYRHPLDLGFGEFVGFTDARHAWEHFPKELWFGREKKPVKGHAETIAADNANDFMKRHRGKPFFLYVAFITPHLHIEAAEEDLAPYRGKFKEKDPTKPLNATYAAMISRLDREVGRILQALDDLKLGDNTLVVFTSDHGATFEAGNKGTSAYHDSNFPFRGQKRTLWEGGIRVPAAVRWPGQVPAGKTSEEVLHMTDVFPTFLAAAGARPEPAWKVTGADVLDVWRGKAKAPERTLYWEWRVEGYQQLAAMRGSKKLVVTGGNPPDLFDVVNDPGERRSVRFEYKALTDELHKGLKAWLATETEESKWGKKPRKPAEPAKPR
jgi:arylsulfatase A-like enzyme